MRGPVAISSLAAADVSRFSGRGRSASGVVAPVALLAGGRLRDRSSYAKPRRPPIGSCPAWGRAKRRATDDLSRKGVDALIGGATVLVRDGAVYNDPTGAPPSGRNPETMVGVSDDGRRLTMVVIDGRQASSIGVTPAEAAEYLVAHGADSGLLLDGGGSSTAAAQLPGTTDLTILNHPSDATGERPVANGLFVYDHK